MSDPNFEDVLDMPASAMERPKPLPVGEYIFVVQGPPKIRDYTNKEGEKGKLAEFECRPTVPQPSVDMAALQEYGWPTERTQRLSFFLTAKAMYRLKDFIAETLGLEVADDAKARQLLAMVPNSTFIGTVKHSPSRDGKTMFSQIDGTARV